MSGSPRDLAVLDHWSTSLERSRARRARSGSSAPSRRGNDGLALLSISSGAELRARDLSDMQAWELSLGRPPSVKERSILTQYYDRQLRGFQNDTGAAQQVAQDDFSAAGVPLPEAAAMVSVARTIFNSDAFITRE